MPPRVESSTDCVQRDFTLNAKRVKFSSLAISNGSHLYL